MGKGNLAFGDIETEKKIYGYKSPALLRDVHIEKVFATHKIFFLVKKTIIKYLVITYNARFLCENL